MGRSVPVAQPRSKNEIEEIARKIIQHYQPEVLHKPAVFDIERFFDCDLEPLTGVKPDYRELPAGIHGYTDFEAMESVISKTLADDDSARRFCRSTIGHEVGHAGLHVRDFKRKWEAIRLINNGEDVGLKLYRAQDIKAYLNPEWQAWRFCKSLLMPASVVSDAVRSGYSIKDLSDAFDLTPAFVKVRVKELGFALQTISAL